MPGRKPSTPTRKPKTPKTPKAPKQLAWPERALNPKLGTLRLEDAYEIGRMIADNYGAKPPVTEIIRSQQLGLSRLAVHRAFKVYGLCQRLGVAVKDTPLGFAHLTRLALFPTARQRTMYRRCVKEGWSVRRLESELAVQPRKKTGRKRGLRGAQYSKTLRFLDSLVCGDVDPFHDVHLAQGLPKEKRAEMKQTISAAISMLQRLKKQLD